MVFFHNLSKFSSNVWSDGASTFDCGRQPLSVPIINSDGRQRIYRKRRRTWEFPPWYLKLHWY